MFKAYPVGISSTDERLRGIIERLKNGASLVSESNALGYSNNVALRGALTRNLGKEQYEKLVKYRSSEALKQRQPARRGVSRLPEEKGVCQWKSIGKKIAAAGKKPAPCGS